jgi:hypothetical protein
LNIYKNKIIIFFFYNLIKIWSTILDDIHVQLNMVIISFLGYFAHPYPGGKGGGCPEVQPRMKNYSSSDFG